jgi:hypothetical protein
MLLDEPALLAALPHLEAIRWSDLALPGGRKPLFRQPVPEDGLLRTLAKIVVECQDYGGADAESTAEELFREEPRIAAECGMQEAERLATLILVSEIPTLSKSFQVLFEEFNRRYFASRLPRYRVLVVFDLHRFADEPVFGFGVSSGLIRPEERCIYVRYSSREMMERA